MNTSNLIYQTSPTVTIATNTFIDVPVILKYENINLIEIIKELGLGFTTQIPIYHSDGTYLAKVRGTRIYSTKDGEKAGLSLEKLAGITVCKRGKETLFEIRHQSGDSFKTSAELYTPDGYFVKCTDQAKPSMLDKNGTVLKVGNLILEKSTMKGFKVGIWFKQDGSCSVGVNI